LSPYLVICLKIGHSIFVKKQIRASIVQNTALWFVLFAVSCTAFFILLEPELWANLLQNIQFLFVARLLQQQRFLQYFNDLSLWQIASQISAVALRQPWFVYVISGLVVIKKYTKGFTTFSRFSLNKSIHFSERQQLFCILMAPILGAVFYYGRVGFVRYFYFAVISIYALLVVLCLSDISHDDKEN
jgi:hypothetical protein